MTSWLKARLGRFRVSTIVLIVVFVALFWVQQTFQPGCRHPRQPAPAVVPPGFVPDPNYTWVPRTQGRRPKEPESTTTTTTTTDDDRRRRRRREETTTSPTSPSPTTTVVDPDGPVARSGRRR